MSINIVNKWLKRPEVKSLLHGIPKAHERVRFVGGCVRDAILGQDGGDLDFATSYKPEDILDFCYAEGFKVALSGVTHGTVLVVVAGHPFEITTLRKDIETDGRHAKVEFSDDWLEDAKRRDFTFNSLYLSLDGTLFDPWQGVQDLKDGRVKFIGDPFQRIEEDYLRILRFFRFYARYGREIPDALTLQALSQTAVNLKKISGERIQAEMMKLLSHEYAFGSLKLLIEIGVSKQVFGCEGNLELLNAITQIEKKHSLGSRPFARLLSFVIHKGDLQRKMISRFKFSKKDQVRLLKVAELFNKNLSNHEILYRWGRDVFIDLVCLENRKSAARDIAQALDYHPAVLPIKGADIINLGIPEGPMVSKALKTVETWWLEQEFLPNKTECLHYLKEKFARQLS